VANWWWLVLLALVLLGAGALVYRMVVRRRRRRRAARPRAAAAFGVEAGAAPAVSVRLGVYRILADWAGVEPAKVPPDSKKVAELWRPDNPQLTDGHLADLVARLKREFPGAQLNLAPGDLRESGGVGTIDKLVRHVERRTT
jgi:hypothetical protein